MKKTSSSSQKLWQPPTTLEHYGGSFLHSQRHSKNIVFIAIHAKEQHVRGIQLPDSIEPGSFDLMHQGPFMVL